MITMAKSFLVILLFGLSARAMDENVEQDIQVFDRSSWTSIGPRNDISKQKKVIRIVIGHTVTEAGNPRLMLQLMQKAHMDPKGDFNFSDIAYNECIDDEGNVYHCRAKEHAPSILKDYNLGSCGVGCIGNYHETDVTETMARQWGKAIATIAHQYGFNMLKRGENIFAMSELNPVRYPISPGQHFMKHFDLIIEVANQQLTDRLLGE